MALPLAAFRRQTQVFTAPRFLRPAPETANKVTLTVTDSYGNPLQDQTVTLTLPEGVSSKTGNTVTTNAAGKADIELMSTVAGEHEITFSVNKNQKTATVKFKADAKTGQASLQVDTANFLNSRLNDCCESKCKESAISSIDLAVSLTRMAARQSLRLRMYAPRGMCM